MNAESFGDAWSRYDELFKKYADGIPWTWLKAFCIVESSLGTDPLVRAGLPSQDHLSFGIMQLRPETASDFESGVTGHDLNDPETSVRIAAAFVKHLSERFKADAKLVAMAYNQGEGATSKGRLDTSYWGKWESALDLVNSNK